METQTKKLYVQLYSNYTICLYVLQQIKYNINLQSNTIINHLINYAKDRLENIEQLIKINHRYFPVNAKSRIKIINFIQFLQTNNFSDDILLELINKIIEDKKSQQLFERKIARIDNKKSKVGSLINGHGNRNLNVIRVPSKKHKNRWKNFVKLFPKYQYLYDKYFKH